MERDFEAFGKSFKVSSASRGYGRCVGVCIEDQCVTTMNTNRPEQGMIEFTREEWHAFVQGVKNNEFDL